MSVKHYTYRDVAQFGSIEHDRCLWQKKGVRNGAKQGVMRSGNEQNDYVLTVSHVVVRFDITPLIVPRKFNKIIEMWLSLVERHVRDVEAAGSNPVISTNRKSTRKGCFFYWSRWRFRNWLCLHNCRFAFRLLRSASLLARRRSAEFSPQANLLSSSPAKPTVTPLSLAFLPLI